MCRVLGVQQNSLYVLYGLEGVTDVQKFRVLYRTRYKSFVKIGHCAGSPTEAFVKIGYCVKVVQIPGGIVLEVLQNLHMVRVLC